MLSAKIQILKQKVFIVVITTTIIISIVYGFFYWFENLQNITNKIKKLNNTQKSLAQHFQQKKENIEYISSSIELFYKDISLQQRFIVREKKHNIINYFENVQNDIKAYAQNPFIVKVSQNLVRGYLDNQTKNKQWIKYNKKYTSKLESFPKGKQFKAFYIVAPSGVVVWSTQKKNNSFFQENLQKSQFKNTSLGISFVKGKKSTFVSPLQNKIFVATPIKKENRLQAVLIFEVEKIEVLLSHKNSHFVSRSFIVNKGNVLYEKDPDGKKLKKSVQTSIYQKEEGLFIGSYVHIEKYSSALYIEEKLSNILTTKLKSLHNFYHPREQTNIFIVISKAYKILLSTGGQISIERTKITNLLKRQPTDKSLFIEIDKGWGNVYIAKKINLDNFPVYVLIETSVNKINQLLGGQQDDIKFRLFFGKDAKLDMTSERKTVLPIQVGNEKGVLVAEQKFTQNYFQLNILLLVLFLIIVIFFVSIYVLSSFFSPISLFAEEKEKAEKEIISMLEGTFESLQENVKKISLMNVNYKKIISEIKNVILMNQNILTVINQVKSTFEKTTRILMQKQDKEETLRLIEGLSKHQNDVVEVVNKVKKYSFTSNILSLNAGIEATLLDQKENFSILAKEYQLMSSKMQGQLEGIEQEIGKKSDEIKNLAELSKKDTQFLENIANSISRRSECLEKLTTQCGEQKNLLEQLEKMVKELEEISFSQVRELEFTHNSLSGVLAIYKEFDK